MKDDAERAQFKEWAEAQFEKMEQEGKLPPAPVKRPAQLKEADGKTEKAAPLTEDETIKVY